MFAPRQRAQCVLGGTWRMQIFTVDENEGDHDVKPDGPHGPFGF